MDHIDVLYSHTIDDKAIRTFFLGKRSGTV